MGWVSDCYELDALALIFVFHNVKVHEGIPRRLNVRRGFVANRDAPNQRLNLGAGKNCIRASIPFASLCALRRWHYLLSRAPGCCKILRNGSSTRCTIVRVAVP